MPRLPAALQPKGRKLTEEQKQKWRGKLHMDKPLTPNMIRCLQHMDIDGGNPLTYRAVDLAVSTSLSNSSVTQALGALLVRGKVEKIRVDPSTVYWRKTV